MNAPAPVSRSLLAPGHSAQRAVTQTLGVAMKGLGRRARGEPSALDR
jgi:hypothetical protein